MPYLDPSNHDLAPLSAYCNRIPSRVPGRRLNRATIWRWALRGTRDGRVLRTVQIGGGRFTCDAWVCEFIHRNPTNHRPPLSPSQAEELDLIAVRLGSSRRWSAPIPPEERARIMAELAPPGRRRKLLAELEKARLASG
jgi:hypothetical protein